MNVPGCTSFDFKMTLDRSKPADHEVDLSVHVEIVKREKEPGSLCITGGWDIDEVTTSPLHYDLDLTDDERDRIDEETLRQMKGVYFA
jgi:hypothetical protein